MIDHQWLLPQLHSHSSPWCIVTVPSPSSIIHPLPTPSIIHPSIECTSSSSIHPFNQLMSTHQSSSPFHIHPPSLPFLLFIHPCIHQFPLNHQHPPSPFVIHLFHPKMKNNNTSVHLILSYHSPVMYISSIHHPHLVPQIHPHSFHILFILSSQPSIMYVWINALNIPFPLECDALMEMKLHFIIEYIHSHQCQNQYVHNDHHIHQSWIVNDDVWWCSHWSIPSNSSPIHIQLFNWDQQDCHSLMMSWLKWMRCWDSDKKWSLVDEWNILTLILPFDWSHSNSNRLLTSSSTSPLPFPSPLPIPPLPFLSFLHSSSTTTW